MRGRPRHCLAFDTETVGHGDPESADQEIHRYRLGVGIYFRLDSRGIAEAEVFRWPTAAEAESGVIGLADRYRDLTLWAHNAPFDWQAAGLWSALLEGRLSLTPPPGSAAAAEGARGVLTLDPPPFLVRLWTRSGGVIRGLDTLNFWREPLDRLGVLVGLPKLPMPGTSAPESKWWEYCERDCWIVVHAVGRWCRWAESAGLREFPATFAMAAKSHWSANHKPTNYRGHVRPELRARERAAYYGGRVWCWRAGRSEGPIHQLDVNSLYPSEMRKAEYPVGVSGVSEDWTLAAGRDPEEWIQYIAEVRLDARTHEYPVRTAEGIWYCRGRVQTWLAGPEIRAAARRGELVYVGPRVRYKLGDLFSTYVDYWWEQRVAARKAGDNVSAELAKGMLNSLYGKFAQRPPEWVYTRDDDSLAGWGSGYGTLDLGEGPRRYRFFDRLVFESPEETEIRRAWPAVAAYATSHARVRMDGLRDLAGSGQVLYQATDSLHCTAYGRDRLAEAGELDDNRLGKLKTEAVLDWADYRGPNYYCAAGVWKIGSIRRKPTELSAKAERIGEHSYRQIQFASLAAMLTRPRGGGIVLKYVTKTMPGGFWRARLGPDGTVTPHVRRDW